MLNQGSNAILASMILQKRIPYDVHKALPLPGLTPLKSAPWTSIDEAYAAQMAERRRLLSEQPKDVLAVQPDAEEAGSELLDECRTLLAAQDGFSVSSTVIRCPDGHEEPIDAGHPLKTLGAVLQEDLCLLVKPAGQPEHHLAGAVLCFPASWRLSEKIGRSLSGVHEPVPEYSPHQPRVQKLFDVLRVDRPVTRFNVLYYDDPTLFQPRSERVPRPLSSNVAAPYVRSERQCLFRLPKTKAIVFTIHTYVVRAEAVMT